MHFIQYSQKRCRPAKIQIEYRQLSCVNLHEILPPTSKVYIPRAYSSNNEQLVKSHVLYSQTMQASFPPNLAYANIFGVFHSL